MRMIPLRRNHAFAAMLVLAAGGMLFGACSSSAKGVDACRRLEEARCQKLSAKDCFDADNPFQGDATSCTSFYHEQCGRGLQDGAREPSSAELNRCVDAIRNNCGVAREPLTATECSVFLTPPVAPTTDTGVATDTTPATDAADAADGD